MKAFPLNDLLLLLPELTLFVGAIASLLVGLYAGAKQRESIVATITPFSFVLAFYFLLNLNVSPSVELLNGMLALDGFIQFAKGLVLLGGVAVLSLCHYWMNRSGSYNFEFYVLILLASIGMMLMVSSTNFLSLYMGLELTSLSLYILAAFRRDFARSTEAGLKYFILGSLASGMMLFGISFIYGFSGSIQFDVINGLIKSVDTNVAAAVNPAHLGVLLGMVLVMVGLCFKVSAAPFHMWAPDVYEGAPTPVTAFFATAPKAAAILLFARVLLEGFGNWHDQWQQVVIAISIASMLVGAFAAMVQQNLKRMLAYSSIGHVGYALMAIAAGTQEGMQGLLVYMTIYIFMSAGAFGCVLMMQRDGEYVEEIEHLSGLSRKHPYLAMFIAVFMFSLAGIPPLAGFFGKMYVFLAALEAGLVWLTVIGVLTSVVSAFYYLRIIKIMYFDEEREGLNYESSMAMRYTLALCSVITVFFFLFPAPLIETAKQAASALWS